MIQSWPERKLIFKFLIVDKENALKDEMEINDKLRAAYENLLQKLNKKKRHVGVGSHDIWRDPHLENLERQARDSQAEAEKWREALEKINKQREVNFEA